MMEASQYVSLVVSLACVLMVTFLWSVLNWVWLKPKGIEKILREQGFQGHHYRILYGDSKDKTRMLMEANSKPMQEFSNDFLSRIYPFFHHTMEKYGKKCFMWNGPELIVNIGEPELIREVFMKIHEFQKPVSNPMIKEVATGLVQLEGEVWAKHRRLLNPAFHTEKLKLMLPAFHASSIEMIKKWEDMARDTGSCEVDTWSHLHKLSADAISRAAFGSSYEEGERLFELLTEQLAIAVPVLNSLYIPGWRFVPTKTNRRIRGIQREIKSMLKDIIKIRQKAINAGEKPKDDLLGILLESSKQDKGSGKGKKQSIGITLEEVIDECKIFYLAGQETTSTLLVWTLILLSKHQDWQKRARDEVLRTFGSNNPDFHGLSQLKTVNMILQEVLRLYSPVTVTNRSACQDMKIGDIVIPRGVILHLPLIHVQHDEKLWGDDAKEFNPERFSEGISKATGGNMSFFSFGWGPRICIGSNFAMTEAKLALALILQRFSLELSPSYAHAPLAIATLRPQFGAQIILNRL